MLCVSVLLQLLDLVLGRRCQGRGVERGLHSPCMCVLAIPLGCHQEWVSQPLQDPPAR